MNAKTFLAALALTAIGMNGAFAQTFFWSDLGFGEGAVLDTEFHTTVSAGISHRLYLYYAADGVDIGVPSGGIDFDFGWSQDGVAAFTAAETLDFDITIPGLPVFDPRWGDFFGDATNVTANDVNGFLAVNVVAGSGLVSDYDGSGVLLDEGYDSTAAAFWIGSIDYDLIGTFTTTLVVENSLIVSGADQIQANEFSATIFAAIPEPTAAGILAVGLIGLAGRRRRRKSG